jgi:hypothetical protein
MSSRLFEADHASIHEDGWDGPSYPEVAGSMPPEDLVSSRQQHIHEGNLELQRHRATSKYSVLPVDADGACFLRAMAVQLRTQALSGLTVDIVQDYRLLSVLSLEELMVLKSRYASNETFLVSLEKRDVDEGIRAVLKSCAADSAYAFALSSLGIFDVHCLDKLEGVMSASEGLEQRRWMGGMDITALLSKTRSSATMMVPRNDAATSRRKCYINQPPHEVRFVDTVDSVHTDFIMVHFSEEQFEHFDSVYETSSSKQHLVSDEVVARVSTLL